MPNYLHTLFIEKKIKTPVCFFEETGLLNNEVDKFFTLGMLKCLRPHKLDTLVRRLRDKEHFYDEIKWKKVNTRNLPIMKRLIDDFFLTDSTAFYGIVLYKDNMDFATYFNNDFFKAYQSFATLLLKKSIGAEEMVSVIADHYPAPHEDEFEAKVRNYVNDHNQKLSVHSIIRINSKGSNLIQLADLLMGALNYEFKLKSILISKPSEAKTELLNYLKNKLNLKSLAEKIKTEKFNVMIFNPDKKRT